jgi:hypothetical protein
MVLSGDGKFWLYFPLRFGFEEDLMGISNWRCCRETEIWRAMDTSAAVFRRCSASSISFLASGLSRDFLGRERGTGLSETDGVVDFDIEPEDDVVEASESFLRGCVPVVVPLRERSLGGGAWIFTVLRLLVVKGAMDVVEMLDADVEVEWSEEELVEPDTDGAGMC